MGIKLVLLFILLLSILILPVSVSAQTATGTPTLKQKVSNIKQERKNAISQIREKTKEEIQALRDQFKERLQTIKDSRKRLLIQNLDLRIASANAKHTARFNEVLTRLQSALDRISLDAKKSKILSEIKAAQDAIDIAKVAVASQAAKVYTVEITTETNLRTNVGTTISQFRKDLMQTHKLVVDAKQTVHNLRTDKFMMKKDASNSATQ